VNSSRLMHSLSIFLKSSIVFSGAFCSMRKCLIGQALVQLSYLCVHPGGVPVVNNPECFLCLLMLECLKSGYFAFNCQQKFTVNWSTLYSQQVVCNQESFSASTRELRD
jgi:hypothetical protein